LRIDLHIVKDLRRWHIQSARGISLGVFPDTDDAFAAAERRARELQAKGLSARVHVHRLGEAPEVFDYPPAE
jgi:hypothetical protein